MQPSTLTAHKCVDVVDCDLLIFTSLHALFLKLLTIYIFSVQQCSVQTSQSREVVYRPARLPARTFTGGNISNQSSEISDESGYSHFQWLPRNGVLANNSFPQANNHLPVPAVYPSQVYDHYQRAPFGSAPEQKSDIIAAKDVANPLYALLNCLSTYVPSQAKNLIDASMLAVRSLSLRAAIRHVTNLDANSERPLLLEASLTGLTGFGSAISSNRHLKVRRVKSPTVQVPASRAAAQKSSPEPQGKDSGPHRHRLSFLPTSEYTHGHRASEMLLFYVRPRRGH